MTSTNVLKAESPPFYPKSYQPIMGSDGMPQLVLDSHSTIWGMSDEAVDVFQPSLEDLSELEAVDQWIKILAFLDHIEEKEEMNRESFKDYGKRFEARRRDGSPKGGQERAARLLPPSTFKHKGKVYTKTVDMVQFDPTFGRMRKLEGRLAKRMNRNCLVSVKCKPARWTGHTKLRPIHQPGKF